jgi:hypothetical protein
MKAGLLDQSRARKLVSELESICKRNGWPVVALVLMGAAEKTGIGLMRINPNDEEQMSGIVEYPLVGNAIMAAGIVYASDRAKQLTKDQTDVEKQPTRA